MDILNFDKLGRNQSIYKTMIIKPMLIGLGVFAAMAMNVYAQTDEFLAEQRVENPKVTDALITEVKADSQKPISDQLQIHDQKAKQQLNEIKQETLEENAVSDYELKRKTDASRLLNAEKHEYIPGKPSNVTYTISYEYKNVRIGNHTK